MKLFQITFTNLEWQPPSAFTRLHHTVKNHFCLREPMSRHGSLGGSTCKHSSGHRHAGAPAARAQARPGRPGQPPAAPGAGSSQSQSQSQPSGAPRTAPPGRPARPCGRACEGRREVPSVTFPEEVAALPPQELVPEGAGGVLVRQRHLRQPQRGLLGGQRGARPRPPHGHGAPRVPLAQLRPRPGHQQLRAALRHPGGQHHAEAEQHFTAAQRTGFIEELCYRAARPAAEPPLGGRPGPPFRRGCGAGHWPCPCHRPYPGHWPCPCPCPGHCPGHRPCLEHRPCPGHCPGHRPCLCGFRAAAPSVGAVLGAVVPSARLPPARSRGSFPSES